LNNKISVQDFRTIVRALSAAYPRDNFIPDEYSFNLWYTRLQDIPYITLKRAADNYIMTNRFAPTIADMRSYAQDMDVAFDMLAAQAWDQLLRALRMSYAPESEQVWNELPDVTKQCVGGYATFRAWGNTENSSLESVQRPMFIKRFEELQKRVRKEGSAQERFREPLPSLMTAEQKTIDYRPETPDKAPAKPSGRSRADDLAELRKRLSGK
jgi:hypothetical protein